MQAEAEAEAQMAEAAVAFGARAARRSEGRRRGEERSAAEAAAVFALRVGRDLREGTSAAIRTMSSPTRAT